MLNNLNLSWVKNVYNQFINSSKNIGYINTLLINSLRTVYRYCVNTPFTHFLHNCLYYYLYTYIIQFLYLLNSSYTHNPHSLLLRLKNEI